MAGFFVCIIKAYRSTMLHYLSQLAAALSDSTFDLLPELHQLRRTTESGFECLILARSEVENGSYWELHSGIRNEEVEGLVYTFTQGLRGFRKDAMTLVVPHWKLLKGSPRRFVATDESSLPEELLSFAGTEPGRFFNRFRELAALDRLFNAHPEGLEPWLHNDYHRAVRGIGIQYLRNPHSIEDLWKAHRSRLQRRFTPEQELDTFDRLAAYLMKLSPN